MLNDIKILIRSDCYGWLNSFKHDRQAWRKSVLKGIGYLTFIAALSVLGFTLFSDLQITDASSNLLLSVINGFILFGIIIVAKELMESSLKILFEAPDTQILHAAPIRPIAIFGYKFIHITATRLLSIFCFLGPPWVVFGVLFNLPWHFYVSLLPVSLCLLVIIASYVTISMMIITRFFSSVGLLTTLKIVGTALSVAVGFLLSFTLFSGSGLIPVKRFLLDWATASSLESTPTWYPHVWIGELLLSWNTESTVWERLRWGLMGFGVSIVSVGLALFTAQCLYQRGWENIRQLHAKRKPTRSNENTTLKLNSLVIAFGRGKIQSLMMKDFLIFVRHTGRIIAIVMLTLFLAVHIVVLLSRGSVTDANTAEILTVQVVLYSLLITFGISCNGLRDENKTWWMLKSAPVTPKLIFTSKFLTAFLCAITYAEFWSLIAVYLLDIPAYNRMSILVTPLITLPVGCVLNTMIGTLPWMTELTHQPKPILRVLTFTFTLFIDVLFVLAPIMIWHINKRIVLMMVLIIILASVFVISYRHGVRNIRKLLIAQ